MPGMMISVVMLLAAATLVHSQASHCPPYNTLNNIVYLAHQHDCSMFLRCDARLKIQGRCPPGKHFSPSTSTCEDPATAGCTALPEHCTAGKPQKNCRYSCSCSFQQKLLTCPANLEFPINIDVFFWVDASTCSRDPKDTIRNTNQLWRMSTKKTKAKVGLCYKSSIAGVPTDQPHFADCKQMVRCGGTAEQIMDCPRGKVYDANLGVCDTPVPGGVTCKKNPAPRGGCPTTRPLSSCRYTCECSMKKGKCPAQLHYDATINVVDSRSHPNCRTHDTLITLDRRYYGNLEMDMSKAVFDPCPAGNQPGVIYVPDPLHCGTLHRCGGGPVRPVKCPSGSQFDVRTNKCGNPRVAAKCQTPPQPTLPPPPSCPTSATCSAATRVRHPTDCTLYCECIQGAPYLGACPPGLHFSQLTLTCEPPGTANCQTRCSKLPVVDGGKWDQPQCSTADSLEKTKCTITCDASRQLMGSADLTCTSSGWYGSQGLGLIPSCNTSEQLAVAMGQLIGTVLNTIAQAHHKAAMLFVMDESGSVEEHNFEIEKSFVESVVTAFPLSKDRSAGVITFSSNQKADVDIDLTMASTCDFIKQLKAIKFMGGFTDLAGALALAIREIKKTNSGSSKTSTLVFVITDGKSESNPNAAAEELRKKGHIVFTIGVTRNYVRAQLEPLSSTHTDTGATLFFGLSDFSVFQVIAEYLKTTYGGRFPLSCP